MPNPIIRGRTGGQRFDPSKLPGLQLWLRADRGLYQDSALTTPAVADGDPVGGWKDQSGQGRHATQATAAARPTLVLGPTGLGGQRALLFDGVDDQLLLGDLSAGFPSAGTLFYLYAQGGGTGRFTVFDHNNGANNSLTRFDGAGYFGMWRTARIDTYPASMGATQIVTVVSSSSLYQVYKNNTAQTAQAASYQAGTNYRIVPSVGGNVFVGHLPEILAYSRQLTGTEISQVNRYLGRRYGIVVS
jgi:hypothetical protein